VGFPAHFVNIYFFGIRINLEKVGLSSFYKLVAIISDYKKKRTMQESTKLKIIKRRKNKTIKRLV
jgi:P2-related tail formation protein